ncbi:MAG: hypothetical protein ABIN94_08630 [Ferruginibacter sp.]
MTKNLRITEKTIAIILILWGTFVLIISMFGLYSLIAFALHSPGLGWRQISPSKVFKIYHFEFILSIVTLVAGWLLISGRKLGWASAVVVLIYNSLYFLLSIARENAKETPNTSLLIFSVFASIVFFAFAVILLFKPFRFKYSPGLKSWMGMAILLILLIVDGIVLK